MKKIVFLIFIAISSVSAFTFTDIVIVPQQQGQGGNKPIIHVASAESRFDPDDN